VSATTTEPSGPPVTAVARPRRWPPTVSLAIGAAFALWGLSIGIDRLSDNSFLTHLATGRLILADGLAMASEAEPDAILDLATLTGAVEVALGSKVAGLLGSPASDPSQPRRRSGNGPPIADLRIPATSCATPTARTRSSGFVARAAGLRVPGSIVLTSTTSSTQSSRCPRQGPDCATSWFVEVPLRGLAPAVGVRVPVWLTGPSDAWRQRGCGPSAGRVPRWFLRR